MTLADFTSAELLAPMLRGRSWDAVILELAQMLERAGRLPDATAFFQLVLERERLVPTDVGDGIAMPHGRVPGLQRVSLALGSLPRPMRWGHDAGDVQWVVLLAVPTEEIGSYLQVISGLARLARDPALRERIRLATDPQALLAALQQIPIRGPSPTKNSPVTPARSQPFSG